MIKQTIALFIGLSIYASAFSQRVDGKVTLVSNTQAVEGRLNKMSFDLYKGAVVHLRSLKGGIAHIQLEGYIKNSKKLPAVIYSDMAYNHVSGKLFSAKKLHLFGERTYFLEGDIKSANINIKDLPEWRISELIGKGMLSEKAVKATLSKYKFHTDDFFGYSSYFYYQNDLDDPSPGDRIRILFKKGKLKGVIHQFCVGYLKPENKLDYAYLWIDPSVDAAEKKQMMSDYTKFRRSVD
ncbi:hypothetical protein ACVWYN_000279 [Pedobacter sp. UYP24]